MSSSGQWRRLPSLWIKWEVAEFLHFLPIQLPWLHFQKLKILRPFPVDGLWSAGSPSLFPAVVRAKQREEKKEGCNPQYPCNAAFISNITKSSVCKCMYVTLTWWGNHPKCRLTTAWRASFKGRVFWTLLKLSDAFLGKYKFHYDPSIFTELLALVNCVYYVCLFFLISFSFLSFFSLCILVKLLQVNTERN